MENEFEKIIRNIIWMTQMGRNGDDIMKISLEQINVVLRQPDVIKSVCPKCACEPAVRILGEYHCEICGHSGW